ncbi:hypothetical protein NPIL_486641 [Nephila pilipes]|uniref:Uncharacterized protein n=1 Tax=Nephila pilipes TaxID=299642 RepID=A0A8X6TDB2_NEPPI|nr:hypothetical protein NPIL_486641 [Nephila pilipes]
MLHRRTVLEPYACYPIPVGMHYILITVQKTALDVIPESVFPELMRNGFHLSDFRKSKYYQKVYKSPLLIDICLSSRGGYSWETIGSLPRQKTPPPVHLSPPESMFTSPQPVHLFPPEPTFTSSPP